MKFYKSRSTHDTRDRSSEDPLLCHRQPWHDTSIFKVKRHVTYMARVGPLHVFMLNVLGLIFKHWPPGCQSSTLTTRLPRSVTMYAFNKHLHLCSNVQLLPAYGCRLKKIRRRVAKFRRQHGVRYVFLTVLLSYRSSYKHISFVTDCVR